MRGIPVVPHYLPAELPVLMERAERLAAAVRRERPELARDEGFRQFQAASLDDAPALHLDDMGEIRRPSTVADTSFLQDRARLRAGEGDFVAAAAPPPAGYEEYCRDLLGLGRVEWLCPRAPRPTHLALACWHDRPTRRELLRALRAGRLRALHPFMGALGVWELAALLHDHSRRPVEVIAPLPEVTRWVNDKGVFAETVQRLLGLGHTPRTETANNLALLAERVREFIAWAPTIGIKLPDSAGGSGNLVLPAAPLRGCSLRAIREVLQEALASFPEQGETRLLLMAWESRVLSAPSAQLWIPPAAEGPPALEGLFEQLITGREGYFAGCRPAALPAGLARELAESSWLLAALFQLLGYVGRCSFDAIVLGEGAGPGRLEFVECNGRWGGTSLPMTLMNRLFGDWARQPYAAREWRVPGLGQVAFADLLECFTGELFDVRTGRGSLILYNPTALSARSRVNAIALGASPEEAIARLEGEFPERLQELAALRRAA